MWRFQTMDPIADPVAEDSVDTVRFALPRSRRVGRGGYLLLVPGLLIVTLAVAIAYAEPGEGEFGDLGNVLAPYIAVIGMLPLAVGVAVLRRHRVAQVLGIVLGGLYGAFFILSGLGGNVIAILLGLVFILAAFSLLSAFRAGEH